MNDTDHHAHHHHHEGHAHGPAHDHEGHGHSHDYRDLASSPRNRTALRIALVVTLAFFFVELVGGVVFNSLALLSDAAHMLTDAAAYALALFAAWIASLAPTQRRTYGYARAEILAALVNGATLIAASGWIVIEAIRRLDNPVRIGGTGVMAVAAIGLVANLVVVAVLSRADRGNLNIRAAMLHGATDALASVGVLVAGALIAWGGFLRADPIASLLIAALIMWGSWRLVRESVDALLDAVPPHVDTREVAGAMLDCDGVREVHDLHVWTLGPGSVALSAHLLVDAGVEHERAIRAVSEQLRSRFGIDHSTLQVASDRSAMPLEPVERVPLAEAIEWAADHVAAQHPGLARSVILAAAGAASLRYAPDQLVSPVSVAMRTLSALGRSPDGTAPYDD